MLGKAANSLPGSHLFQVDILARNWPRAIKQPFDRVVSGYTLHEFPEEMKLMILRRLASECLAPDGMILIADISFSDQATMREEQDHFISEGSWDEEEFYWCAEMLLPKLEDDGFEVDYIQSSPCAGIYRLSRK
jgi:cyclopropane fatty-acyl-phospholipid synthase-like methyltransferase